MGDWDWLDALWDDVLGILRMFFLAVLVGSLLLVGAVGFIWVVTRMVYPFILGV